jgi:hypothetical protein
MPLTQVKTSNLDTTNSLFFRNRIINGDMRIDQRKAGASLLVNGNEYTLDRWNAISYVSSSFVQKFTTGRNLGSVTPPAGFTNYLGISVTTAYNSWASGDFFNMVQFVEGYSIADFAWGTASAKPVTLSFWVRGSVTGTYTVAIRNQDSNRSYAATYTISTANTWTYVSITIPGETSGTWYTDNSRGLELNFDLGRHSSYETSSSNTWSTSGSVRIAGTVRLLDTANATLYITGVQLEVGTAATAFETRPFGTELQLCQRYFETSYAPGTAVGTTTDVGSCMWLSNRNSGVPHMQVRYVVQKRATATFTTYNTSTGTANSIRDLDASANYTATWSREGPTGGTLYSGTSIGLGNFLQFQYTASAEL